MKRWYVVFTHSGAEAMAQGQLARQSFVTYLPKYRKNRRHGRLVSKITVPLFPRYIFVELDLDNQRWRAINSTYGVRYLVCLGNHPKALPQNIIPEIREREAEDGFVKLLSWEQFNKGETVQITAGPLINQIGLFECADDERRNIVLMKLLGREVQVRLDTEDLRAYA